MGKAGAWLVATFLVVGCSGSKQAADQANSNNTGKDAGSGDVNPPPPATDAGVDAGEPDAGPPDAGTDAGVDAGPAPLTPGSLGVGPWPTENVTYGAADGIQESLVVGMSTDETQNLWVATRTALYLMRPGETHFTRFGVGSGLHLPGVMMDHCYDPHDGKGPIGLDAPCANSDAGKPGISEIVGGGPDEVLVGYWGTEDFTLGNLPDGTPIDGTSSDPWRHTGKIDRVRLHKDASGNFTGAIDVVKLDFLSNNSNSFWHNRSVMRMLYDHFKHPHELYAGFNHGVDKFSPDLWFDPNTVPPGPDGKPPWFLDDYQVWMSDHLHPEVCNHAACPVGKEGDLKIGDWRGLALDADGDLWVGGRWTAGAIKYLADNSNWYNNPRSKTPGDGAFKITFGDPYTISNCSSQSSPVFCPPLEGDPVNISTTTITADGRVWFASGTLFNQPGDVPYGIAYWSTLDHHFHYLSAGSVGMTEADVRDMVALPDGHIVFAGLSSGLVFWDPATNKHVAIHAGQGIPDDNVMRLELDTMVDPPVLHVSTRNGATSLRQFPQF